MKILGIDPGTLVVGYGIIDSQGEEMTLVCCNALTCSQHSPLADRLNYFFNKLSEVINHYKPDVVVVEQPFVAKNVRTALAIGKAQTVAILAASQHGIPTYEYSPAQIKRVVTNYGASSKEQIQEMVRLQLGLTQLPEPNDIADALAVAICHLREIHLKEMLAQQSDER
jgi:crossover junction endodeoxyribonuclease RuvC